MNAVDVKREKMEGTVYKKIGRGNPNKVIKTKKVFLLDSTSAGGEFSEGGFGKKFKRMKQNQSRRGCLDTAPEN